MKNKKALDDFLKKEVPHNAQKRFNEEKRLKATDENIPAKLDHMLCRSEAFINDKKYKYILITNDICKDTCCQMTDYTDQDWAKFIEWEAVFDFNPNTFKYGLGHLIQSSRDVLVKPSDISGAQYVFTCMIKCLTLSTLSFEPC